MKQLYIYHSVPEERDGWIICSLIHIRESYPSTFAIFVHHHLRLRKNYINYIVIILKHKKDYQLHWDYVKVKTERLNCNCIKTEKRLNSHLKAPKWISVEIPRNKIIEYLLVLVSRVRIYLAAFGWLQGLFCLTDIILVLKVKVAFEFH